MSSTPGLYDDLSLMREAVADAAVVARDIYEQGFESWRKAGHEPVTDVDMAVNAHLEQRLKAARPSYGWLSEETRDDRSRFTCSRVWVVDPIDGTRAILKGKPHFVISLALVEDGKPLIGILLNPVTHEHFEAVTNGGATLNGDPIHVTDRDTLEGAHLMMYADFTRYHGWRTPFPKVETSMVNSVAYRLGHVAAGVVDACLTIRGKSDWDLAAAALIVEEAGGVITDRKGCSLTFNTETARHDSVVAAGPKLHGLLVERLRELE